MRVGFYNHTPLEFYGGGEVTEISLANWLARSGWEVDLWTENAYRGPRRISSDAVRTQLDPAVRYGSIPFGDRRRAGLPFIYASTMPAFDHLAGNDANLMFLPMVPDRAYLVELAHRGVPMMFLLHSLTVDRRFPLRRKILFNQLLHRSTLYGLRRVPPAPRLFYEVLNLQAANLLRWHGVSPSHVWLIPTGVDFSRYSVGPDPGRFRVVFLGRIEEPWKGIGLLKRVIQRTSRASDGRVEFVVIGSGPAGPSLRDWATSFPEVSYRGFVSDAEKTEGLASASLMISTSGTEPYGLSAIEGLASGLPLVATPTAGSEFILTRNPAFGTLASFSAQSLSEAILAFHATWARDPRMYLDAKLQRRERARELFDLPVMQRQYDQALRALTDEAVPTKTV